MAIWQKPPREQYDLFVEYMQATYPALAVSTACDGNKKLTHFEINGMSDEDFGVILSEIQQKFPSIF